MILNDIQNFITQIMSGISWDIVLFAGIGFEILLAIFFIIKSHYSYEMRMVRKFLKLNNWLNKNKFIDQSNLLEFNNLMKHTPKLLRYHWHQYMLYRDRAPSEFMSTYNLVEKPLKTSSYLANIKNYIALTSAFAFLFLFFGLTGLGSADISFSYLSKCIATPFIMIFINILIVLIMRVRQNSNLSALFQYAHYFDRFMDKAVTTMPEYVDFEVLFTRNEIRKGIPVLNEYLEKRARQEQEELEKARLNAVEHENFDFRNSGTDGALVLERAIKETETYLHIRTRLLSEIQQLESEIESIKRNFENTQKDYQKKMQVSKENVDRLRKQQEETTNRIESNYIKKQQADEIKKQEQLEKDNDSATIRFNQEMDSLTKAIEASRADLEEKRKYVEEAMKAEYQTFSTKMYKSIYSIIEDRVQYEKDEIVQMKDEIAEVLEDANFKISERDQEITELKKILKKNHIDVREHSGFYSEKLQEEVKKMKRGKKKHDENEDDGKQPILAVDEKLIEEAAEDANIKKPIPLSEIPEKNRNYGEDGGFFDKDGNYRYNNGTYFDPEGRYFDEKGGWYEADGKTYHGNKSRNAVKEPIKKKVLKRKLPKPIEEIPEKDREYGEDGGFFDKQGYYHYQNGAYFDPQGRYFDELGGWFEADGKTYHEPNEEKPEDFYEEEILEEENDAGTEDINEAKEVKVSGENLPPKTQAEIDKLKQMFNVEVNNDLTVQESEEKKAEMSEAKAEEEGKSEEESPIEATVAESITEEKESEKDEGEEFEQGNETEEVDTTKRRRGRPRKVEAEEQPKKKAGRPRKTEVIEAEPKKRAGRPRKDVQVQEKTKSRGRPKKEEIIKSEQVKRAGRPKKEANIEEKASKATKKETRGRPKKEKQVELVSKGRGRPKKAVEEKQQADNQIKKGRGRPKKAVEEKQQADNQIKKGRGRPRKESVDELEILNKQIEDENKKLTESQEELNKQIHEALSNLEDTSSEE